MKHFAQVIAVLSGLAVLLAFAGLRHAEVAPHTTQVVVPATPPAPTPTSKERSRKRLLPMRDVFGSNAPDGTEPAVDFPPELWFRNVNSKRGGDGMCVFTAWEFCALWAGLYEFKGFRDWCAERYLGGGWPAKLAQLVQAFCTAKNIPKSRFDPDKHLLQYEGSDFSKIEACLKNGWMPAVSLFHSPRYGDGIIYHMTNCPHLDSKWGCIQDNNFKDYEWSSLEEFKRRVMNPNPNTGKQQFWMFTAVSPGPPPPPTH